MTSLSEDFAALLSRVAAFDALVVERDTLAASLKASRSEAAVLATKAAAGQGKEEEAVAAQSEARRLRAQLALVEDEARLARPMRDALVKEIQVSLCSRITAIPETLSRP